MDLPGSRLLECLAYELDRLTALAEGNLAVAVPTCPGWEIGDLVRHVAHGLANVALRQLRPSDPPPEQDLAAEEPIAMLRRCHAAFVDEVSRYPTDDPGAPAGTRARFWLRRMTHEIVVHRVDVERAIGQAVGLIPPDLAVDGVAEALSVFLDQETHTWRVDYESDLSDWGDRWLLVSTDLAGWRVTVRPEGAEVASAAIGEADAAVRGGPVAMLLWLYGRGGDVVVEGDDALVDQVRRLLATAMG